MRKGNEDERESKKLNEWNMIGDCFYMIMFYIKFDEEDERRGCA